ncbi:hypothetical protein K8O68_11180 [Salipaludibacillus sp. CUR1]|uniref:hypothetical protein n=1 Tax=Salipaludibacillus sp. CUR1 TaxID=2820003 RepID=UPI001E3F3626|nr:hypothetical protein [Salipaludibacillus sp. CUR1]MCE7792979.1 hypothetical protein [Salipaludibacillus sp. CUR1]
MRKYVLTGLAAVFLMGITACNGNEDGETNAEAEETMANTNGAEENEAENNGNAEEVEAETEENEHENENEQGHDSDNSSVSVDTGASEVTITLPPSLFEEEDPEDMIAEEEEEGIYDVTMLEDGTVTYTMSKEKHEEMMQEMEKDINETIEETKNSEDFVSISDITYNDSYSEFTMIVEQETFENSFDGFAAFGLGLSGMFYQLFDGVDPDNFEVIVHFENEHTGEVFETMTFPEDLDF